MNGCRLGSTLRYWSESTPMAHLWVPLADPAVAAPNTPVPDPPAAAYTTSAPAEYIAVADSLPLAGSLNPPKSGGSVRYFLSTLMFGLTALAPATYPAANFWIRAMSTPPTKPMCPVLDF